MWEFFAVLLDSELDVKALLALSFLSIDLVPYQRAFYNICAAINLLLRSLKLAL